MKTGFNSSETENFVYQTELTLKGEVRRGSLMERSLLSGDESGIAIMHEDVKYD